VDLYAPIVAPHTQGALRYSFTANYTIRASTS